MDTAIAAAMEIAAAAMATVRGTTMVDTADMAAATRAMAAAATTLDTEDTAAMEVTALDSQPAQLLAGLTALPLEPTMLLSMPNTTVDRTPMLLTVVTPRTSRCTSNTTPLRNSKRKVHPRLLEPRRLRPRARLLLPHLLRQALLLRPLLPRALPREPEAMVQ